MRKKSKLVRGVGINDSDQPINISQVIDGKKKILWSCPIYIAWRNMLSRCHGEKSHVQFPEYSGCTVDNEWFRFSRFREWMINQDHVGMHLDKDILISGNRVYGPNTCVLVSSALNKFLTDSRATRGEWPIGVHLDKRENKFKAQCNNPFTGKRENLGIFICANEAHETWRSRKHELSCAYAEKQTDPRIAEALRMRFANKESINF